MLGDPCAGATIVVSTIVGSLGNFSKSLFSLFEKTENYLYFQQTFFKKNEIITMVELKD